MNAAVVVLLVIVNVGALASAAMLIRDSQNSYYWSDAAWNFLLATIAVAGFVVFPWVFLATEVWG